jgi:glycosyltransferase involved in cell wall biosynthesis
VEVDGPGGDQADLTAQPPRLRIACSGVVGAEHGSVASAGFEVLRELLGRGHEVDFFSKRSFVYPDGLVEHRGFTYRESAQPRLDAAIERLPTADARWYIGGPIGNAVFRRRIVRAMLDAARGRRYDVELFLGLWAYGRIPGLPVVSWVQGPPGTDARSVIRHGAAIRGLCGWREYAKLRSFARYRSSRIGEPAFEHTDVTICGSAFSKETLVTRYGHAPQSVRVLPYPMDLETFRPATLPRARGPAEMIWIGRIVPRKRLDLFLDAGACLLRAGIDVRLKVIGGYQFAAGYHQLIERFPFPDRLVYLAHVPRPELRQHMQAATVLVQPSEEENFGSAVAEALACGTPVVLGPTNGTGDYLGTGGVRFGEYSAAAVADAVRRIVALGPAEEAALRIAARDAAVKHFAVDRVVDRLEEILRSARAG